VAINMHAKIAKETIVPSVLDGGRNACIMERERQEALLSKDGKELFFFREVLRSSNSRIV